MNIFLHELKAYRKSTFIWTGALLVLVVLFMSMFPSFSKEIDEFKKVLEGFPEGVRRAFGIQVDTIGSIIGFYSYAFTYLILVGAIQGMNLGISIISKETREKTADFLLTKPVTRTQIITSKLLAAILSLLITAIIYIATALIMASIVKTENYSIKVFLLISLSLFFIQLLFLSLGILVATVFPKIKSVIAVSLGIVFMFYFIGMLSGSSGEELTRYFSPFKYFDPAAITKTGSYEVSFVFAWIVMILLSIGVSYFTYKKKDIHTV